MTVVRDPALAEQLARMARAAEARRTRFTLRESHVTLSHGSGGTASHALLTAVIAPAFDEAGIHAQEDSARLAWTGAAGLAFTTDSFVVSPLFFPGGDIGRLAVHGTVNDLAMSGAVPLHLALALIVEEGFEIDTLRRVIQSVASAAAEAGVRVVTGDTKVVPRGKADGLFITTSGIGALRPGVTLSPAHVRPGDRVLLSGTIGDHGIAVMLAREALELESDIRSDSAPLHGLAASLLGAAPSTRCLKDPTRGGVATALNEISQHAGVAIVIDELALAVKPDVRAACEILGIDPLHVANEGKFLAIVPPDEADAALGALRAHPLGADAAVIGEVRAEPETMVLLRTSAGGSRVLDMLVGDPLPRIC